MAYVYLTLAVAENLLASLLADPGKVRFVSAELRGYIVEAIRTWSALSNMYEEDSPPITVNAGTIFLDLPTVAPAQNAYTITETALLAPIEYHLIEPQSTVVWLGTEMFTLGEIVEAITRRRDQFLLETRCRVDRVQLPATILFPGTGNYELPETTIAILRAAWQATGSGKITPIWRSSHWSIRTSRPGLEQITGIPRVYDMHSHAPPTISPSPIPADSGTFDLLLVRSGPANLTYLGIPDDFSWAVKWGAMADLLGKDGPAKDYARSLYCERRYRLGVAAMLARQTVTDVRINGRPAKFTTIDKLDSGRMYWQNLAGTPQYAAPVGANMLVLADPPSAPCSVEVRTTRNAPVPAAAADYVQVGPEFLDMLLGYAVHLAMFKVGGTEFASTTHFANSMLDAAAEFNARLKESAAFEEIRFSDRLAGPRRRGVRRATGASVGGSQEQGDGSQGSSG